MTYTVLASGCFVAVVLGVQAFVLFALSHVLRPSQLSVITAQLHRIHIVQAFGCLLPELQSSQFIGFFGHIEGTVL